MSWMASLGLCALPNKEVVMLVVKVLGSGCANCKKVEETARKAVNMLGMQAEFVKVTDYAQITEYPILSTPGLVINEKVVCSGRIPQEAEVVTWLADALESE
jgi:small redox-active disulfide protein 2